MLIHLEVHWISNGKGSFQGKGSQVERPQWGNRTRPPQSQREQEPGFSDIGGGLWNWVIQWTREMITSECKSRSLRLGGWTEVLKRGGWVLLWGRVFSAWFEKWNPCEFTQAVWAALLDKMGQARRVLQQEQEVHPGLGALHHTYVDGCWCSFDAPFSVDQLLDHASALSSLLAVALATHWQFCCILNSKL